MRPEDLRLSTHPSPIGDMLVVADADGRLRALDWYDFEPRMRRLLRLHYGAEGTGFTLRAHALAAAIAAPLDRYFRGDLTALNSIPVTTGGTAFQRSVWTALRTIPAGTTTGYGALAARLGKPGAARAVGLANGANPWAWSSPATGSSAQTPPSRGMAAGCTASAGC